MERVFQIVAVILAGIVAYFLWKGNSDGAFISGVLGAVCFFLSFRFQIKEKMKKVDEEKNVQRQELEEKMRFEDEFENIDLLNEKQKIEK